MERHKIRLLADISAVTAETRGTEETLKRIVDLVAKRFHVDVCSVYLLNEAEELELKATIGLRQPSVGAIRMKKAEGLTGLVLEKMAPLLVVDPPSHERYKHFAGSGEETYQTFLGLPLAFHQQVLGVLVIQTVERDAVSEADIPVFSTIAGQIAATLAYGGALNDLQKFAVKDGPRPASGKEEQKRPRRSGIVRGIGVSRGVAEGRALYLRGTIGFEQIHPAQSRDPGLELQRLDDAFRATRQEMANLIEDATGLVHQEQAILEAHQMFLSDKTFRNDIRKRIHQAYTAESALKHVVGQYVERFRAMEDPYLRERSSDVEDIGRRVLRHLLGSETEPVQAFREATILIGTDISPMDLVRLRNEQLKGVVLSRGGRTSHSVILAKSFEIPMVIGASDLFEFIQEGDHLIVDGMSGLVFDDPPEVIVDEYRRLRNEAEAEFKRLDLLREERARTADGTEIQLGANIGLLSDLDLVKKYGADHIGLYRTEFPFLARRDFPSEEEQAILYEKIVVAAENRPVTIRTLDVGGDKFLSYLDFPKEQNPYLGWRSIRVSLDMDEIFRTQIRAILRVSPLGDVRIMFPMITSVKEVQRVMVILAEEKEVLRSRGVAYDEKIPAGIMVEVPAAVRILKYLLNRVDFVSIGTNDLVQYILAVDRNNEKVASLYDPLHPAVIEVIAEIVALCRLKGKTVTICGEAASNPVCGYLFVAMGADRLSMNAAAIPVMKDFLRKVSLKEAKATLERIKTMDDTDAISEHMAAVIADIQREETYPARAVHR